MAKEDHQFFQLFSMLIIKKKDKSHFIFLAKKAVFPGDSNVLVRKVLKGVGNTLITTRNHVFFLVIQS